MTKPARKKLTARQYQNANTVLVLGLFALVFLLVGAGRIDLAIMLLIGFMAGFMSLSWGRAAREAKQQEAIKSVAQDAVNAVLTNMVINKQKAKDGAEVKH